jgi:hypothetical protein
VRAARGQRVVDGQVLAIDEAGEAHALRRRGRGLVAMWMVVTALLAAAVVLL